MNGSASGWTTLHHRHQWASLNELHGRWMLTKIMTTRERRRRKELCPPPGPRLGRLPERPRRLLQLVLMDVLPTGLEFQTGRRKSSPLLKSIAPLSMIARFRV